MHMAGRLLRLFDALFPPTCQGCTEGGAWWCAVCEAAVVRILSPGCPACGRLDPRGRYCARCRPKSSLTGVIAGARHREPLTKGVKALKYRHATRVAAELTAHLSAAVDARTWPTGTVLVPIPLHPRRERRRGHNQAALIAAELARTTGLPLRTDLKRIRATVSQTTLPRRERLKNLDGAFHWTSRTAPSTILLVDDVMTTGATLNAAGQALRDAGARQIWGAVLAKR